MKSVILVVVVMLSLSVSFANVNALIHAHTTFSDGRLSPDQAVRQARAFGADVVILTDHADEVGDRVEQWKEAIWGSGSGYGMEIGLGPKGLNKLGQQSHVLYLGGDVDDYNEVVRIAVELGQTDPDEAIVQLRALADKSGAALIAAHPVSKSYPFREKWLRYVDAVELYDNGPDTSVDQVLLMVGKFARQNDGRVLAITGGSDFDGGIVSAVAVASAVINVNSFAPDLLRFTVAETEIDNPGEVIRCIKEGNCGACFAKVPPALMTSAVKTALGAIDKVTAAGKSVADAVKFVAHKVSDVLSTQPAEAQVPSSDESARPTPEPVGEGFSRSFPYPFPLVGRGATCSSGLKLRFSNQGGSEVDVEVKPGQILGPAKDVAGQYTHYVVVKAGSMRVCPFDTSQWLTANVWQLDYSKPNPGPYVHFDYVGFSSGLAEAIDYGWSVALADGWDQSKMSEYDIPPVVYQAVDKYVKTHPHPWEG